MENLSSSIGMLGIVIMLLGQIQYLYELHWTKTASPHAFTWTIWGLVIVVGACAQFSEGERWGVIPMAIGGIFSLYIALYSALQKKISFTRSDWVFFLLALFAIPLWIFTKTPLYSVLLVTFIDAIMYFPTLRKTWKDPYNEPLFPYITGTTTFALSFFLFENFSLTVIFYPSVSIFMNLLLLSLVYSRRKIVKKLLE